MGSRRALPHSVTGWTLSVSPGCPGWPGASGQLPHTGGGLFAKWPCLQCLSVPALSVWTWRARRNFHRLELFVDLSRAHEGALGGSAWSSGCVGTGLGQPGSQTPHWGLQMRPQAGWPRGDRVRSVEVGEPLGHLLSLVTALALEAHPPKQREPGRCLQQEQGASRRGQEGLECLAHPSGRSSQAQRFWPLAYPGPDSTELQIPRRTTQRGMASARSTDTKPPSLAPRGGPLIPQTPMGGLRSSGRIARHGVFIHARLLRVIPKEPRAGGRVSRA